MTVGKRSALCDGLIALIGEQPDMEMVGAAASLRDAVEKFVEMRPEVVVVDVDMPDEEGLEIIRRILLQSRSAAVIALVTYEWDQLAVAALAAGAVAFLPKDWIAERLVPLVRESSSRM